MKTVNWYWLQKKLAQKKLLHQILLRRLILKKHLLLKSILRIILKRRLMSKIQQMKVLLPMNKRISLNNLSVYFH